MDTSDISAYMQNVGQSARQASRRLSGASTQEKSDALQRIAAELDAARDTLKAKNAIDMEGAAKNGIDQPLIDRLLLDDTAIDRMIEGIGQVDTLPDPVGEITDLRYRPTGIQVGRMRVPLGVIGIIYESRPNVTVDAAALCLKSGNACILRGGSEAIESNKAIAECVTRALSASALPVATVQLVETTDRAAVGALLKLDEYVDIIVPRGGRGLIERIIDESRIPVIKHLDGVCHVFLDRAAEPEMAVEVALNSKISKLAVCCAAETVLVHEAVAAELLPPLDGRLDEADIEVRGCEKTRAILNRAVPANEDDWYAEYLGPTLAVRVVENLDGAIDHINRYGSQHTDTIVTNDLAASRRFMAEVDSASVMVNASTQFADGFEYGLGAEVGISTDKIHARGPVGLEGLTSQKYVVFGNGELRHR